VRRIFWLDRLPSALEALVIGNEVLDAMPVHLVKTRRVGIDELGVTLKNGAFEWSTRPAGGALLAAVDLLELPAGYTTEIHLAALAFIRTLAAQLARGVILMIDYGFPAREYYHPQRESGTLMCHHRHHAHSDPLRLIGLQDITAHLDFSALARAGIETGCELLGYTNQAQFLINCGVTEILAATPAADAAAYLPLATQAQKLLSPAEMGELFKVIALGKRISMPLLGFRNGDKRHTL
jgi:SAM-dependent MidA family methyltransferase